MENMVEIADKVESPLPITIVCSFLKESILQNLSRTSINLEEDLDMN